MQNSSKSGLFVATFIIPVLVLLAVFLSKVTYSNTYIEMAALTAAVSCGSLMALFFLLKPFETILVYFALSSVLIMLDAAKFKIPGFSSITIGFGGIIQTVILVFGAIACMMKKNTKWPYSKGIQIAFSLFLLWLGVSITANIKSIDLPRAIKEYGRIIGTYIVFLLCLKYTDSTEHIKKFIMALFVYLVVPLGYAIYQFFTMEADIEGYQRLKGTFGISNTLASNLLFPLLILLLVLLNKRFQYKISALFCFYFLLFILFCTYTRSVWLGFIVGVLYIGVTKYKRLLPYTLIAILLLFLLFSADSLRLGKSGSSGRIGMWTAIVPVSLSSPIFGHGLAEISDITLSQIGNANCGQNEYFVHLLEAGFIGLAIFIFLLVCFYRVYHSALAQIQESIYRDIALSFLAYFLGVCMISFFESVMIFQNWVCLPAGVFLGFCINTVQENNAQKKNAADFFKLA